MASARTTAHNTHTHTNKYIQIPHHTNAPRHRAPQRIATSLVYNYTSCTNTNIYYIQYSSISPPLRRRRIFAVCRVASVVFSRTAASGVRSEQQNDHHHCQHIAHVPAHRCPQSLRIVLSYALACLHVWTTRLHICECMYSIYTFTNKSFEWTTTTYIRREHRTMHVLQRNQNRKSNSQTGERTHTHIILNLAILRNRIDSFTVLS